MEVDNKLTVQLLGGGREDEALDYLASEPVQAAYMRSLLLENGPDNPQNRGKFYAACDAGGRIRGLALVGNLIVFVADGEEAVDALARHARMMPAPRLVRGERSQVERFWQTYARARALPHTLSRECMLVRRARAGANDDDADGLRLATAEDLPLIIEVNARMFCDEGGGNPLARDPEGFRSRLARRIERGHIWVWREADRLIFKTDVIAETPQAVYVEGVYVAPEARGRGVGTRYLSRVARELLARSESICLTVGEENQSALALYRKAGFLLHCPHSTIYLQQAAAA